MIRSNRSVILDECLENEDRHELHYNSWWSGHREVRKPGGADRHKILPAFLLHHAPPKVFLLFPGVIPCGHARFFRRPKFDTALCFWLWFCCLLRSFFLPTKNQLPKKRSRPNRPLLSGRSAFISRFAPFFRRIATAVISRRNQTVNIR